MNSVPAATPAALIRGRSIPIGTQGGGRVTRNKRPRLTDVSVHEIGVVGLATMGMNLARNLASHGARVVVYNRTRKRTDEFMQQFAAEGDFQAAGSLEEMVATLQTDRARF